jgi:hypothetical protein
MFFWLYALSWINQIRHKPSSPSSASKLDNLGHIPGSLFSLSIINMVMWWMKLSNICFEQVTIANAADASVCGLRLFADEIFTQAVAFSPFCSWRQR